MRFAILFAAVQLVLLAGALQGCDSRSGGERKADLAIGEPMGPLEEATNRQGRDISQGGTRTDTAAQCSDLCGASPSCKAMSFAKDAADKGGICLLKSDVPAATENPAVTSAVKIASAPAGGR